MTEYQRGITRKLSGIAVSPGIIIGKAHLVDRETVKILYQYLIGEEQVKAEIERFGTALETTERQLTRVKNGMADLVKEHAFIIESHLMILKDSMLTGSTIRRIEEEKINAEWALKKSLEEIRGIFRQIEDEYISTRITDVENVADRILRNLAGEDSDGIGEINERVIIVAHDLSPADTSELNIEKVMGFITDAGGRTSHAGIIAQALEIPAIVGLESATVVVQEGDLLIVDGNSGDVVINPDDSEIIHYQERQLGYEEYKSSIALISHLPAVTSDGHRINVSANVEFLEEVAAIKEYGGEGIGLYRTEILYLRSRKLPSEQELFEDYREVAEIMAPACVTIRTLDLGGDKIAGAFELMNEANPALGMRAIRFCLKEPAIFKTQLKAILRASIYGQVQILFPMISGLRELLDAKELLDQAKRDLEREKVDFDDRIRIGIMIEVPSAVTMADVLAEQVDFFSIGTNDLIQYALASDRINEHVAYMFQPFHPAILRMIKQVVMAAKEAGIGLSICGEMAGDPLCIFILVALGIEDLSLNSRSIPLIKKIVRALSRKEAEKDLENIFRLKTADEVRGYMMAKMQSIVPELEEKGYLVG